MNNIRKEYINYSLPSESDQLFESMINKDIKLLSYGVLKNDLSKKEIFFGYPYGGPIILSLDGLINFIFNYDDLRKSIVIKESSLNIKSNNFLLDLYRADSYVPIFLQAIEIININDFNGKKIKEISIFKDIDDLYGEPTKYKMFYELLIAIKLIDNSEFFIMRGFQIKYQHAGNALTLDVYNDINPTVFKRLKLLKTFN